MVTRNDFNIECVSGGFVVECAFPFADYSKGEKRVVKDLKELIKLLKEYYKNSDEE